MTAQALAQLLSQHREEIAANWSIKIDEMATFQPAHIWLGTLSASMEPGLGAAINALRSGETSTLDEHLAELSLTCIQIGFECTEITDALLLSKEAILPVVRRLYSSNAETAWALLAELDAGLRWVIRRFGTFYQDEMNRRRQEQRERMAQMLELARLPSGQVGLGDILLHVAQGIMTAVASDHCDYYLVSEDQSYLTPRIGVSTEPRDEEALKRFLHYVPDLSKDPFLRWAIQCKEPVVSHDALADPLVNKEIVTRLGIRSVLAVPLVAHNQVLALAMTGTPHGRRTFTAEQIELAWNLARSAALVVDNVRLHEARLAESQSIQRVTSALLQKRELAELFEVICAEAQQLTGACGSAVFFLEDDWLQEIYSAGDQPTFRRIPNRDSLAGEALRNSRPSIANDPGHQLRVFSQDPTLRNILAAPLRTSTSTLGVLYVANKPHDFTEADAHVIALFADQAAIAIENMRLHEQVHQLAALEERERLAREIHDNLAQALSVLKLQASHAGDLLRSKQYEQVDVCLGELRKTATEAQDDARDAIFSLRRSAASATEFLGSLRAHLDRYQRLYGLEAELIAQDEELISLPPAAVVQLTRIIQEALTNVRKHALANRIRVQLEQCDDHYCITVEDDGQGFDPEELGGREYGTGGVGLQIMQERAGSLGGTLIIDSKPGQGTRIIVQLPLTETR